MKSPVLHDFASYITKTTPPHVAQCLESCDTDAANDFLDSLVHEQFIKLAPHLSLYVATNYCSLCNTDKFSSKVKGLDPELIADWVRPLPQRQSLVSKLPTDQQQLILTLTQHRPNSAGSIMDSTILPVAVSRSVGECLVQVRQMRGRSIYYLYIVDEERRLVGVANLRELIEADKSDTVAALMTTKVKAVPHRTPLASVAAHPGWQLYSALPVVDQDRRYLGAIRYEALRRTEMLARSDDHSELNRLGKDLGELYAGGLQAIVSGVAQSLTKDRS